MSWTVTAGALAMNVVILIAAISALKHLKMLSAKYIGFGLITYLITRLVYTVVMSVSSAAGYSGKELRIVILGILFVLIKVLMYSRFKPKNVQEYISLGFGEALNTLFCIIYPTVLNNLVYSIRIGNQSIFSAMQLQGYSEVQIQSYVDLFLKNTNSYYLFTAIAGIIPIVLHIAVAIILKGGKKRIPAACLVSLTLTYAYYGLPYYSYPAANCVILTVLLIIITLYSRRSELYRKEISNGITTQ